MKIDHCGGIFGAFWGDILCRSIDKPNTAPKILRLGGECEMKYFELILLCMLLSPFMSDAQEIQRATRPIEEQRAISQISQAEYYMRMAMRSLEISEKIGNAPFFNYQMARSDIEKVVSEFNVYLRGKDSTDLSPAVPLVIDGRYFAESIKNFLATQKTGNGEVAGKTKGSESVSKAADKNVKKAGKKNASNKGKTTFKPNSTTAPYPTVLGPQNNKARKDKIEEILKKGL